MLLIDKEKLLILFKNRSVKDSVFQGTLMMCLSEDIYEQKFNNLGVVPTSSCKLEVDHLLKSKILLELNFFSMGSTSCLLQAKEKHFFLGKVAKT
ncbi:hypothetical protein [Tenacibaculum xiamenense]|uniref:hypothetical protein n=1 Tax=Tenacibaculum xiamenense TaxID=1261553 RepID=UPI003895E930